MLLLYDAVNGESGSHDILEMHQSDNLFTVMIEYGQGRSRRFAGTGTVGGDGVINSLRLHYI